MDLDSARDTVDDAFDTFGVEAVYEGGDDVNDCRIIIHRRSKDRALPGFSLGGLKIGETFTFVSVRTVEVADPVSGGAFTVTETGRVYRIGEDAPMDADVHGLAKACACVAEAS